MTPGTVFLKITVLQAPLPAGPGDLNIWMQVISNLLIWGAYFIIPLFIVIYLRKRGKKTSFNGLYLLFAAFILISGVTYFIDALVLWQPYHYTSAVVRMITAIISWVTVFYVVRILPDAFSLKSPSELQEEIDRRIRAEHELKTNNERLLEAERTARLGHGYWDLIRGQGHFSDMAYQILGISSGALLSYELLKYQVHPADIRFVEDCLKKNLKARNFREFYFRIITSNMEIKHVLLKAEMVRNAAGKPILLKGTLQDVSELRRHMQKIEQQNKRLKKIAWVQSHRMRSPVATIIGLSDLLNRDNPADPMNADIIEHIKVLSVQLDDMIREVDDLTREKSKEAFP